MCGKTGQLRSASICPRLKYIPTMSGVQSLSMWSTAVGIPPTMMRKVGLRRHLPGILTRLSFPAYLDDRDGCGSSTPAVSRTRHRKRFYPLEIVVGHDGHPPRVFLSYLDSPRTRRRTSRLSGQRRRSRRGNRRLLSAVPVPFATKETLCTCIVEAEHPVSRSRVAIRHIFGFTVGAKRQRPGAFERLVAFLHDRAELAVERT